MPTIYGSPLSPFVRKVRACCHVKGIAYALEPVNPFDPPAGFLTISPLGRIPAFVDDDGFAVADSSAIVAYLEHTRPDPPLHPADARGLARALFLEEMADADLARLLGTPFFERSVKPSVSGQPPDEDAIRRALHSDLPPLLDHLEQLDPCCQGIVDGCLSVADLALASPFVNLELGGEKLDAGRWPRLARYLEAILAQPCFSAQDRERARARSMTAPAPGHSAPDGSS